MTRDCGDQSRLLLFSLLSGFPFLTTHAVQQAIDFRASGWLAKCSAPHLLTQQFHDTLCLQYHHPLSLMPALCVEEILV